MERYAAAGYETWYVHGFDGKFYGREQNYDSLGFRNVKFNQDLAAEGLSQCHWGNVGFEGICDSSMVVYLERLLSDSVTRFVYWTTLDSHPPYDTQKRPESEICKGMNDVECIHAVRIRHTLEGIAYLAKRHPEYRFVVRGDHRPMGALTATSFITSFYHLWVPMVVLNLD